MRGIDWLLRHFKKEPKNLLDFKRDAKGKLKDADDVYESTSSKDFDDAVWHQLVDVPQQDKEIHEADERAYKKKKRDSDNDSR